jgi:ribonuclease P protein component
MDERLRPHERLRRRTEFLRCYRLGRRRQGRLAILYSAPNETRCPRLGITASRKVGNAVARARLKRRVREIYRRWEGRRSLPDLDLVVHLQPGAAGAPFADLETEILGLLGRVAGQGRS